MVTLSQFVERNNFIKPMVSAVNSPPLPHREATGTTSTYHPYEDYASIRRIERPAQAEDNERSKKEKKWSFGKLFRRKKKGDESSSSAESDEGVSTRSLTKRKGKKKKRIPALNNFDHIVMRDSRRAQSLAKPKIRDLNDDGVLSDPSAGFTNPRIKYLDLYDTSKESLSLRNDSLNSGTALEVPSRRTKKGRLKAREAMRNSLIGNSSSDEESSIKSSNSSSMLRFRSEDSLMRSRDGSLNKRSRSARNQRYIKRLSRDEENLLNKEAELLQQGYTKAEVEMLTRTPTSQSSGYGTCKRDQANKTKQEQTPNNEPNQRPLKSESISSFPSTHSYPSSINFNAKVNNDNIHYSVQYPTSNVNREPLYANNVRGKSMPQQYENKENVICVKFPIGNVTNAKKEEKAPPVPPPRDMQRKVATPISMYYEQNPYVSDRLNNTQKVRGVPNNDFERIMRRSQDRTTYGINGLRRPMSSSEDHIAMQNNEFTQNYLYPTEQPKRPASVSAEPNHALYVNTPPWRKKAETSGLIKPEPIQPNYLYYADQSPRSRRPISIKTSQISLDTQNLSDSHYSLNKNENFYRRPRNASEFWKKMDDAERQRQQQNLFANSRCNSEYSSRTQLNRPVSYIEQTQQSQERSSNSDFQNKNKSLFNPQIRDTTDNAQTWKATTEYKEYKRSSALDPQQTLISPNSKTHVRHKSETSALNVNQAPSDEEKNSERRKSTNLDDALNELEAIYNSLGLGDEDLLDRAERRELMSPKFNGHLNDWNGNDGELQLRSQPTTPLRRVPRRSTLPDKLQDDMAFRRLNSLTKEKSSNNEPKAQISYMLASPVYIPYASDDDCHSNRKEPDIVHDDVMYRTITQTNNRLKTLDPQPPFGIPIGPVSPAPQSDYLHATPENKVRSCFVKRREPDIVSDDLAYRNLRKENRHSSLYNGEDYYGLVNNNSSEFPLSKESVANMKKKRAVRSLSANIFTMIQKEIDDALNMSKMATIQKTQSNSDVMRRLRETFENNDNGQDSYPRNKVKHRHNTVNLFVNNIHAPSHNFAKDDSYITQDEKFLAKPPPCDKSKSSSPSNRSPQVTKRQSKDEFQQVLTMLAQEAMDTSNKLGVALAELDKNRNNQEKKSDVQTRISDSRLEFLNGLTNRSSEEPFSEIKHVEVHSEVIQDKNNSYKSDDKLKAKETADSLLTISDQLHKVEDQLKHSIEKEFNFEDESLRLKQYPITESKTLKAQETTVVDTENKLAPNVVPLRVQNDSLTIEESSSSKQISSEPTCITKCNSLNPFLNISDDEQDNSKDNPKDGFQELKEGISDLLAGISQVNDKFFVPKPQHSLNNDLNNTKVSSITEANEQLIQASQQQDKQTMPKRASVNLSIYEGDLDIRKGIAADCSEYNSSEELATIFKAGSRKCSNTEFDNDEVESIRDELSSPKLVQSLDQQLKRLSVDQTNCNPSQSNSLPTNVVPWRTKRQNSQAENRGDNQEPKRDWLDSSTLMLACSYTLLLSHHLAELDWLTLLGLILAMITIIAMLLL